MTHTLQAPISNASEAVAYAKEHIAPGDLEAGKPACIWLSQDRLIAFVKAGEPKPSPDNVEQACRLKKVLAMSGVQLADFILLAERSFYSFAEETTQRI